MWQLGVADRVLSGDSGFWETVGSGREWVWERGGSGRVLPGDSGVWEREGPGRAGAVCRVLLGDRGVWEIVADVQTLATPSSLGVDEASEESGRNLLGELGLANICLKKQSKIDNRGSPNRL